MSTNETWELKPIRALLAVLLLLLAGGIFVATDWAHPLIFVAPAGFLGVVAGGLLAASLGRSTRMSTYGALAFVCIVAILAIVTQPTAHGSLGAVDSMAMLVLAAPYGLVGLVYVALAIRLGRPAEARSD